MRLIQKGVLLHIFCFVFYTTIFTLRCRTPFAHLTVLIGQRRLRLRVRSDDGVGRTVRRTRHVVTAGRGVGVVSLVAHRRDVETLVAETGRVKSLETQKKNQNYNNNNNK